MALNNEFSTSPRLGGAPSNGVMASFAVTIKEQCGGRKRTSTSFPFYIT